MTDTARNNEQLTVDTNAWFYKETPLEELLVNARPLGSIDDLAIEDLTPEDARSFLSAVEE